MLYPRWSVFTLSKPVRPKFPEGIFVHDEVYISKAFESVFHWIGASSWNPCSWSQMTSENGNIFCVTGLCAWNSPVTGEFPSQRPVTRSFDIFFDLHLNKLFSKRPRRRWFETPSCSLWRHCNVVLTMLCLLMTGDTRSQVSMAMVLTYFCNIPVSLPKY